MRHRLGHITGLGNPNPALLNNKGTPTKAVSDMFDEALVLYFEKWGGADFRIEKDFVRVGIEPAYQGEHMQIIQIHKDKDESFIVTGIARGAYGSEICSTTKMYADYKNKCKFTKFIDKWHPLIFPHD